MACLTYERLVTKWVILIYESHPDQEAVASFWAAIDHRATCEVCRDECLIQGCYSMYYMLTSRGQLRGSSI